MHSIKTDCRRSLRRGERNVSGIGVSRKMQATPWLLEGCATNNPIPALKVQHIGGIIIMTTKDTVNKIIMNYWHGFISYATAETEIIRILKCDEGDVGVMIHNKKF